MKDQLALSTTEKVSLAKDILAIKHPKKRSRRFINIVYERHLSIRELYDLYYVVLRAMQIYEDPIGFDRKDLVHEALASHLIDELESIRDFQKIEDSVN